ncbi:putative NAD+ synthase [Paratrimastix pyriformis]|uniref:NAD+ synthase n=1 Tax=Paratrimastix pyriformis TaxID=342808 RepID=A0ABQ8UYM3_9EUKA|nr:putative NAD+ synthase [Paratrimastix pyriformis]|eukprot:GAFH01002917.1.p1 GENE.GAFH01002917.1~~GAFH01002917.1.p1  ORF type:complete len:308 (-),score=92.75 GAFH01002917.1:122-1018(-)
MPQELHTELQAALAAVRAKRAFNENQWIEAKCRMLNDYMTRCGLKACVINMSGGVDSSITAALCKHAMEMSGSPIKKVLAIAQPIKSTASIQGRAFETAHAIGVDIITVDQSSIFDQLQPLVDGALGMQGNQFAKGQLKSYMRTPVAFYTAQVLSANGLPAIVIGTGNMDEDGYLFYFCKAGDGISDIQLIADLHKSEVFRAARALGVPQSVLVAPPSADLWDGQTDEDEIGASYDFVELYTSILAYPKPDQERIVGGFGPEARAQFDRLGALIEGIHRRNKHKEKFPINLNVLAPLF